VAKVHAACSRSLHNVLHSPSIVDGSCTLEQVCAYFAYVVVCVCVCVCVYPVLLVDCLCTLEQVCVCHINVSIYSQ